MSASAAIAPDEQARRERCGHPTGRFVELGGHSLSAMRIVARARTVCGLEVPLKMLLQSPTIAAMAGVIVLHEEERRGGPEGPPSG